MPFFSLSFIICIIISQDFLDIPTTMLYTDIHAYGLVFYDFAVYLQL